MSGYCSDGRTLGFYEADYIATNQRGEIYRVETFHDKEGLLPILELLGMAPKDLSLDSLLDLRKEAPAGG